MPKLCGYLRDAKNLQERCKKSARERCKKPARRKCAGPLATVIRWVPRRDAEWRLARVGLCALEQADLRYEFGRIPDRYHGATATRCTLKHLRQRSSRTC